MKTLFQSFAVLLGLLFVSAKAPAASTPWQENKHGAVRLIADVEQAPAQGAILLGFQFKTIPGWHVYWKNAGDAGYPPKVDWSGTQGLEKMEWLWSAPHRYELPGDITAIGYEGEAIYPVRATVHSTGNTVHVNATVSYLTCGEECVPYKYTFVLDLPAGGTPLPDTELSPLLMSWADRVAQPSQSIAGLTLKSAFLESPRGSFIQVDVSNLLPLGSKGVDMFFEKSETLAFAKPSVNKTAGGLRLQSVVSSISGGALPETIPVSFIVTHLTLQGKSVAVADRQTLSKQKSAEAPTVATKSVISEMPAPLTAPPSLPLLLLLAWIGGLILNVMPCVLPVLSIKLLGLLQHAGHERRVIVRDALASAAGIEASFASLGGAVLAAKAAGRAVGWGIQFQEPLFVGGLAVIVLLFALNLWGLFEIQLPRVFSRLGAANASDEGLASYFTSGLFATLLATPCSAPFLGTAMGFALTQSALVVMLIFLAAGVGMAMPYLLLAIVPQAIGWMPRPGAWMLRVKQILGFLLAATTLWLLSILSHQLQPNALIAFTVLLLGLAFVIWCREMLSETDRYQGGLRMAVWMGAALLLGGAFLTLQRKQSAVAMTGRAANGLNWVPFSEDALHRAITNGQPVFLDFTADWCFTCKVNEARVLGDSQVVKALGDSGAILMRADWTNHDPAIGEFLKRMGRAGIPFNAYYRPGESPILFSEFLSKRKVLDALEK